MSMKNPLTPAVIEPANFRFVAQHLNHCATAVLQINSTTIISYRNSRLSICVLKNVTDNMDSFLTKRFISYSTPASRILLENLSFVLSGAHPEPYNFSRNLHNHFLDKRVSTTFPSTTTSPKRSPQFSPSH